MNDAILMVGELHYEKRQQQHEIEKLLGVVAQLGSDKVFLEAEVTRLTKENEKLAKAKGRK